MKNTIQTLIQDQLALVAQLQGDLTKEQNKLLLLKASAVSWAAANASQAKIDEGKRELEEAIAQMPPEVAAMYRGVCKAESDRSQTLELVSPLYWVQEDSFYTTGDFWEYRHYRVYTEYPTPVIRDGKYVWIPRKTDPGQKEIKQQIDKIAAGAENWVPGIQLINKAIAQIGANTLPRQDIQSLFDLTKGQVCKLLLAMKEQGFVEWVAVNGNLTDSLQNCVSVKLTDDELEVKNKIGLAAQVQQKINETEAQSQVADDVDIAEEPEDVIEAENSEDFPGEEVRRAIAKVFKGQKIDRIGKEVLIEAANIVGAVSEGTKEEVADAIRNSDAVKNGVVVSGKFVFPGEFAEAKKIAPTEEVDTATSSAPTGKGGETQPAPFKEGDRVQDQTGQTGPVEVVEKKEEAIESGCDLITAGRTSSSRIVPPNSVNGTANAESPSSGGEETFAKHPKVLCKISKRIGTIAQGEEWEGRTRVVWEGLTEQEAVRSETLWKPGDRFYYITGKPGEIVDVVSSDLVKVRFGEETATVRSSKLFLSPPGKKSAPVGNKNLGKLISQTTSLLENAGYEWEVVELPTALPEVKVKAIASGNEIGEIWFFPNVLLCKYYPQDGPAGGCSGEWCWSFSDDLFEYLDYEDRDTLREVEEMTIFDIKFWQLLELPLEDINFQHYVGNQLVKLGISSDYKIDEKSLQLLVPEDTNLTAALGEVDRLMEEVNNYQRNIPAKGSDRIPEPELFPDWEKEG